jgi:hypothetical protein
LPIGDFDLSLLPETNKMEKFTQQLLLLVFFLMALNALATEAHPDYGEAFQQSGHANMTDPVFGFCERLAEITTCVTVCHTSSLS